MTRRPPADTLRLCDLPNGCHARVLQIQGGKELHRKLLSLGLRVGSELNLLQHRHRGVVVATHAGTRLALGGGIAEKLLMQPLPDGADADA
jgi:ferrous iron transport protein A